MLKSTQPYISSERSMSSLLSQQSLMSNIMKSTGGGRSTAIASFPDEILLIILSALGQLSKQSLAQSLQTCSRWCRLGRDLLWKDIVLDPRNADNLLRCFIFPTTTFITSLAMRTRSLTVLISHPTSPDPWLVPGIRALAKVIPYLQALTTFSLTQIESTASPWDIAPVNASTIREVLNALPESVRHLDIDVAPSPGQDCICKDLAHVGQHLDTIRLSYPRICTELFANHFPMQYMAINMCRTDIGPFVRLCTSTVTGGSLSWDNRLARAWVASEIAEITIIDHLKTSMEAFAFLPNLQELRLIAPQRSQATKEVCVTVYAFTGREALEDVHIATMPLLKTYQIHKLRHNTENMLDSHSFEVHHQELSRNVDDTAAPGTEKVNHSIRSLLQGPCGWYEDVSGTKHPPRVQTLESTFSTDGNAFDIQQKVSTSSPYRTGRLSAQGQNIDHRPRR